MVLCVFIIILVILVALFVMANRINVYRGAAEKDSRWGLLHERWTQGPDGYRAKFADLAIDAMDTTIGPPIEFYDQIGGSLEYTQGTKSLKLAVHNGQRKLFISELRFLTDHAVGHSPLVVYAGSAPGNKSAFLASLFPRAHFILVDPNPFVIVPLHGDHADSRAGEVETVHSGKYAPVEAGDIAAAALAAHSQIAIIQSYFTSELARAIRAAVGDQPVLFISDIRTNVNEPAGRKPDADDEFPGDADIIVNSAQQYNWIKELRPEWSLIKFRLPFRNARKLDIDSHPLAAAVTRAKELGIDFVRDYERDRFNFLDGRICMQAWAGVSSTESRLEIGPDAEIRNYGRASTYENAFHYYNRVVRPFRAFKNPNAMKDLGFDYCNDCAVENAAWERYVEATDADRRDADRRDADKRSRVKHYVRDLTAHYLTSTGHPRPLIKDNHGKFFEYPKTRADLEAALKNAAR